MDTEKIDYSKVDFTKEIPFIRKRCPQLKGKELEEAEETFRDYVKLVLQIFEERVRQGKPIVDEEGLKILEEDNEYYARSGCDFRFDIEKHRKELLEFRQLESSRGCTQATKVNFLIKNYYGELIS